MNPILGSGIYIPDVEARVFDDYVYLYGSKDTPGNDVYCSRSYDVFRSRDFIHWEKFENVFSSERSHRHTNGMLYAPDCQYINGQYCLFYCMDDGSEGVAFSDVPYGPFSNARPIIGADGDGIDPSVFVDDDGHVYYYWGQIEARGAELDPYSWSIKEETLVKGIVTEKSHGFHEGSSMRRIGDTYYYVFADISRGRPTCLGYATSQSPLGPFVKQGIIIDNTGCDPSSWNDHGCIFEMDHKLYVFYHRATHNSYFSRQACVEPLHIDADGKICEVEMTTQGIDDGVPCTETLPLYTACMFQGAACLKDYNDGVRHFQYLSNIHDGDSAIYKYVKFDQPIRTVIVNAARIDSPYTVDIVIGDTVAASMLIDGPVGNMNFNSYEVPISIKESLNTKQIVRINIRGDKQNLGALLDIRFVP